MLLVNNAAVADLDDENREFVVLDLGHDPIVAYSVAPQSREAVTKCFAKTASIVRYSNTLVEVLEDAALHGLI